MDFNSIEDIDNVRLTWNVFPTTKIDATRLSVPIASLYTPLRQREDLPILHEDPVVCRQCQGILNPYCHLDLTINIWNCPFCNTVNKLPVPDIIPLQCQQEFTTMEYVTSRRNATPPVFLYVIDLCLDDENLSNLIESILTSIDLLPEHVLIGLITFGKNVNVYELGNQDVSINSLTFNGNKPYTLEQIESILGLLPNSLVVKSSQPAQQKSAILNYRGSRFVQPVSLCQYQLRMILEQILKDSFPIKRHERPMRATGSAVNIALNLLKSCFDQTGSHMLLFSGGPCTYGPGMIVDVPFKEPLRSHKDIQGDTAKHYKKAAAFYDNLSTLAAVNGHTVDIFVGSYDQVGLYEMSPLCEKTNGAVVLSDSFTTVIFKQSLNKFFSKDNFGFLEMGLNATLDLKVSKNLKINGMIGHGVSLHSNKEKSSISDTEIGLGGTTAWKLCNVTPHSSYGIYFEIANNTSSVGLDNNTAFIQYILYYQHPSGEMRLKVTTIARNMLAPGSDSDIGEYFDQEAAAVLIAREAINKSLKNVETNDLLLWLDKILIDLCIKFGEYTKNIAESFKLSIKFSLFPQFIYHLRRSQFLQMFNNSPDETLFYRHVFLSEDTTNSLIMIQPTLMAYDIEAEEPEPVLLDSLSLKPDRILLLDTFFHILIYHGETIATWKSLGYQDKEDYQYFKDFLNLPRQDAGELLYDRFPLPRFVDCNEGGSQARFLYSKLNPSNNYKSLADSFTTAVTGTFGTIVGGANSNASGAVILTDDVSLQTFMEHVQRAVVKSTN
ncbi:hypothetical protein PACTADRAFT_49418 [Pachysolen tannophilus NRRL Y-2460]|uniref:Protein transport protein SEC23 n=1 Tax=Pachysolen tannophilus NRRL Y-2460 TaxID=669874 RepID=A0A1E4TW84_PACTA|nr:hypothetical protein PACTADRAFT_49418 [Pachysolen tannophilus NRRL Y-2460]